MHLLSAFGALSLLQLVQLVHLQQTIQQQQTSQQHELWASNGSAAHAELFSYSPDLELTYGQFEHLKELLSPAQLLNPAFTGRSLKCNSQLGQYLGALLSLKLWAIQMFDATAKIPEGILYANREFLGQFDECLAVINPNQTITGKHCSLKGTLGFHFPGTPTNQKSVFWYGICVPAECTAEDLTKGFGFIKTITKGLVTVTADENNCSTDEGVTPDTGTWVVVGFLACLGLLGALSTCYHVIKLRKTPDAKPHPLLMAFSMIKNGKSLFEVSTGGDQMQCLNGIRVLSMVWIVFFHVFTSIIAGPVTNLTQALSERSDPLYAVLASAYLAVDSFLLVSGLLLALSFFRTIEKTGTYDAPLGYVHRYFRLTPSYAMILLFQVTLFRYIGDGPMWYNTQDTASSVCREYWWSGLIYVQNFVNPDNLCLTQTWYLSADMQLYWLSPLVFYPMWKWRRFAPAYITLLTLIFTFLPFSLAYINKFAPIPLMASGTLSQDQNRLDNYATYSRATPWLVGVALAHLINHYREQKKKVQFSQLIWTTGWVLAAVVAGLSLLGLLSFENDESYKAGRTSFAAAFYLAFHRLGWSLGLAWLIFASINQRGGPINTFLSWGFFQPMGRLSYGVYLSHVTVIFFKVGVMRTNLYFNLTELFFLFLGVWLASHFIAILLYLFIEAPFFIIDRHLLRRARILPLPPPRPPKTTQQ